MFHCDLNCDMGEGIGNDAALMPYITSANIACGYHAGDAATMRQTILLAKEQGVAIGAHPSFMDRANFGRTEMQLPAGEVYHLVKAQIEDFLKIADECGAVVHHVKPHGALYNMAARDRQLAHAVALAVKDTNKNLVLYGLSGSYLISEAKVLGLKTASEVFADRTYQDNGSLTPRSQPNALIQNTEEAVQQAVNMVTKGEVISVTGKQVALSAETICLHGDGAHAVDFAESIHEALIKEGVVIEAVTGNK